MNVYNIYCVAAQFYYCFKKLSRNSYLNKEIIYNNNTNDATKYSAFKIFEIILSEIFVIYNYLNYSLII